MEIKAKIINYGHKGTYIDLGMEALKHEKNNWSRQITSLQCTLYSLPTRGQIWDVLHTKECVSLLTIICFYKTY